MFRPPPPPPLATGRACTSPEPLGHGDYGAPVTWYKSATPLVACGHQVNVVLVVPQCVDGTAVYWDAQTGTTLLQQSDYAATCASPCLTFQTDVYYRSGETEVQTVYDGGESQGVVALLAPVSTRRWLAFLYC